MEPIDRRGFLRQAGGAVALVGTAALGAGCSNSTTKTSASSSTTQVPTLTPAAWSSLRSSLTGHLVLPSDPGYAASRLVYDLRYATAMPAGVAYCASSSDVQRCVAFARTYGLPVAARSGGHSYGGYSTGTGLIIDVTTMATVTVASSGTTATVGTGTLLIDLYNQLSTAGVLLPGGSCPTVGIAGLTLGGGIGVVGRKYGLTCDNLTALDIVTADGSLVSCDQGQHNDLLWASQGGGGGNFGVATSFTFDVHPMPSLALFTLNWPWAAAADVLGAWQNWAPQAPDELWSNCQLLTAGSSGQVTRVAGVYVGSTSNLNSLLQPFLHAVGTAPTYQFVGPEAYLSAMLIEAGCEGKSVAACHLPEQNPAGTLSRDTFAAKSAYVATAMPSAGLQTAMQLVDDLQQTQPGVGGGLVFDAYGGVINQVAASHTAFVHRDALCAIESSVSWGTNPSPSTVAAGQSWLGEVETQLAPYTNGSAYQNYIDPTLANWQQAYYGANFTRLTQVKSAYDPDNFFHFAQSIPTQA